MGQLPRREPYQVASVIEFVSSASDCEPVRPIPMHAIIHRVYQRSRPHTSDTSSSASSSSIARLGPPKSLTRQIQSVAGKIEKLSAAFPIHSGMIKIDPSQFTCSFLGTFPTNAAAMQMCCFSSFLLIIQENTQTRGAPNNNNHYQNDTDFGLGNQHPT